MKSVAAVALTLIVTLIIAAIAYAQNTPGQGAPVAVAATVASVRDGPETRVDKLLIWNRNIRTTPIGYAIRYCIKVQYYGDVMGCTMTISMPRGKVAATGVVHHEWRYTLVITGGTGVYLGVHGPLFVTRVADGVRRITFSVR